MPLAERIAYWLMRRFPSDFKGVGYHSAEIFKTAEFLQGSPERRREMMLASSQWRYDREKEAGRFAKVMGIDLRPYLEGKRVLDLGCFTGGKIVCWAEQYGIAEVHGLEVDDIFSGAAHAFAELHGIAGDFHTGFGEQLPFQDNSLDTITSWDVLEHVRDYQQVLSECYRTLAPGGCALLTFPTYFNPVAHHMNVLVRLPCLTWFFSGRTLANAFQRRVRDIGEIGIPLQRNGPCLAPWERSPHINGITITGFRRALRGSGFEVVYYNHQTFFSSRKGFLAPVGWLLRPLGRLPRVCEMVTSQVRCVLRKPDGQRGARGASPNRSA